MEKVALVIGVSEYEPGLNLLPGAVKDAEAMQRVLQHPAMGGFDQVKILTNPDLTIMQEEIEALFSERVKDDLLLLFFSGHGITDENGRLYLSTRGTRRTSKGDLVRASAVPASFVQEVMSNSLCKQQVIVLDCCFSGAFANGMTAKGAITIDVQQLSGEGRAVLTSSTATQYSFYDQQQSDLSVYTRYLVEGIETGAADLDGDGLISVEELHEYAQKKVFAAAPTMRPKIYPVGEGFKIVIASAPACDARLIYRREAERLANQIAYEGEISYLGRSILDVLQEVLGLHNGEASVIEAEVFKPHQEYRAKLNQYRQIFQRVLQDNNEISALVRSYLTRLRDILNLRNEDIESIEMEISQQLAGCSQDRTLETEPILSVSPTSSLLGVVLEELPSASPISFSDLLTDSSIPIALKPTQKQVPSFRLFLWRWMVVRLGSTTILLILLASGLYFRLYQQIGLPTSIEAQLDQGQKFLSVWIDGLTDQVARVLPTFSSSPFDSTQQAQLPVQVQSSETPASPNSLQLISQQARTADAEAEQAQLRVQSAKSQIDWQEATALWQKAADFWKEVIVQAEALSVTATADQHTNQSIADSLVKPLSYYKERQAEAIAELQFAQAMRTASQAWELQVQVRSQIDWKAVSKHWQDAIGKLKEVPKTASSYATAQKNVVHYQENLDFARRMSQLSK